MEPIMKNILFAIISPTLATGCASSLQTFDANNKPTVGIPISTPVLVKISEETYYEVDPKNTKYESYCKPDLNSRYQFMALGARSFIAFDPAPLGKREFKVEFNDAGALKTVSLNSDATAATKEISGFLETALPYLAAPKPVPSAQALPPDTTAQGIKDKYCIKKGTKVVSVERVEIK